MSNITAVSLVRAWAERGLVAPGLRPVHESRRVQGDRPLADAGALTAGEVAADVEEDLVRVGVGVVVRDSHGVLAEVEGRGTKLQTTKPGPGEGLVHRRRLVHPTYDRLEVADRERVGVDATVPGDHVERVVLVDVAGPNLRGASRAPDDLGPSRRGSFGTAKVPFGIRGPFFQLARLGQVAARRPDMAGGFENEQLQALRRFDGPSVSRRCRNDHVVARDDRRVPKTDSSMPLPANT